MSDLTDAFAELREAYQETADATPTLTFDSNTVEIMCAEVGVDPVFVGGGVAEGAQITVMYAVGGLATNPSKLDVVTLADHPSAEDGDYQVLEITYREGCVMLILGNSDGR